MVQKCQTQEIQWISPNMGFIGRHGLVAKISWIWIFDIWETCGQRNIIFPAILGVKWCQFPGGQILSNSVPGPLSDLPLPKQTPVPCHSSQNEKDTVLVQEHPCQPRQAPGSLEAYTWFNDITDGSNAIFQLPQEPTEQQLQVTHRKFNSSPLKNDGWKTTFLLGR